MADNFWGDLAPEDDFWGDLNAGKKDDFWGGLQSEDDSWDFTKALKAGALSIPGALTGLADIPAGALGFDRPFDKMADRMGEATGFQPEKWAKENREAYSPELKEARGRINRAWDDPNVSTWDAIKETLSPENRAAVGATVVESLPSTLAGGLFGRAAAGIAGMSPLAGAAVGEGAMSAGQSMNEIRESVDPRLAAATSAGSGAVVGALGAVSGRIAARLGLPDADVLMAGGRAPVRNGVPVFMGAVAQEGLIEELPQSMWEQMAKNFAEGNPLMQGVAQAGFEGAIAGGIMGGGASVVNSMRGGNNEVPHYEPLPEGEDFVADRPQAAADFEQRIDQFMQGDPNAPQFIEDFDIDAVPQVQQAQGTPYVQIDENGGVVYSNGADRAERTAGDTDVELQTDGSQTRSDAGGSIPDVGVHGEPAAVPGALADAERGGEANTARSARSNNAGKGANGVPLTPQPTVATVGSTNAQNPAQGAAPQPQQFDPSLYAGTPVEERSHGPISDAVRATRDAKQTVLKKGPLQALKDLGARFQQRYIDRAYGFTRYADKSGMGMTENVGGRPVATARAHIQRVPYAFQIGSRSLGSGGIGYDKEGNIIDYEDEASFGNMEKVLRQINTTNIPADELVNGLMQNLGYHERETQLKQRKAAAQAKIGALNLALQSAKTSPGTYTPRQIVAMENEKAKQVEILNKTVERPQSVDDKRIQNALTGLNDPAMRRFVSLNKKFNDMNIDLMEKAGLIDQDTATKWRGNTFYSPLRRIMEDPNSPEFERVFSGMSRNPAVKQMAQRFKGSKRDVGNYFDNLAFQRVMITTAAMTNQANRSVLDFMEKTGQGGVTNWGKQKPKDPGAIAVKIDGKLNWYTIEDPLLHSALLRTENDLPGFVRTMEKFTNVLRNAVMLSPDAMMRNGFRDVWESWMYNYTDRSLPGAYAEVSKRIIMDNPQAQHNRYKPTVANYGITGHKEETTFQREMDTFWRRNMVRRNQGDWGIAASTTADYALHSIWNKWEDVAMRVEVAPRSTIFDDVYKRTGSMTEAAMAAQNQLDFRRRGDSEAITYLKATVPFINSMLQGVNKIFRAIVLNDHYGMSRDKAWQVLFTRGAMVAVAASIYTAMMADRGDDEETNDFLNIPKRIRDTSILVPLGQPGLFARLPLPFELGSAFFAIPSNLVMQLLGKQDGRDTIEGLKHAGSSLVFNILPQAIKPLVEVSTNYDYFTDSPITPTNMQKLEKNLQTRPTTSALAKGISQVTPANPLEVDHMLRGYLGSLGQIVAAGVDAAVNAGGDKKGEVDKDWHRYPVVRSLVTDPNQSESKNKLYRMRDDAEKITNSYKQHLKRHDRASADALLKEETNGVSNRALVAGNDVLQQTAKDLAEMRSLYDSIRNDENLDSAQRKEKIDKYRKLEDQMVRGRLVAIRRRFGDDALKP